MSDHDDPKVRPWTIQQWEQFMKDADLRAARYGELMETLIDDPDRDEIIDHEMGWTRSDETDHKWLEELEEAAREAKQSDADEQDVPDPFAEPGPRPEPFEEEDRQLRQITAYILCERLSSLIDRAVEPLMGHEEEEEGDEDAAQAFIQIKLASAKIAAGHGMGYEDEVIGGNVVNCKRALEAAQACDVALQSLASRKILPGQILMPLLRDLADVQKAIEQRIEELRSRMWWEE